MNFSWLNIPIRAYIAKHILIVIMYSTSIGKVGNIYQILKKLRWKYSLVLEIENANSSAKYHFGYFEDIVSPLKILLRITWNFICIIFY